jgi:hypothetical protein
MYFRNGHVGLVWVVHHEAYTVGGGFFQVACHVTGRYFVGFPGNAAPLGGYCLVKLHNAFFVKRMGEPDRKPW